MEFPAYVHGSLGELMLSSFRKLPRDLIFQINSETGESQTAQEVYTRSVQVASGLRKTGVQIEDVIAILSHYSENQIYATFGSMLQGATPFPMEHNLKQREMEHMFRIALPKVVFVNAHQVAEANRALAAIGHDAAVYVLDGEEEGGLPFSHIVDTSVDVESFESTKIDRPDERIAAVVPSSGTTGLPKGVAGTHKAHLIQLSLWEKSTPRTTFLQLTPPFWISGFTLLFYSVIFGYRRIYMANTTGENVVRAVDKYKPRWSGCAPITMARVLDFRDLDKYDMSSLTMMIIGGSSVPHSTINLAKQRLPQLTMCQAYGATEASGIVTIPFDPTDVYSAGKPFPIHGCTIFNVASGKPLGPYEDGEIAFKSPTLMKCYLRNEQATRDAFNQDGFYLTGDIGHVNDKGYIFITGRSKELIKVKNHQVSPAELEDVIRGLPGVADVAVVGIPHEIDQNHPRALVVPQPGTALTQQQIIDEVKDKLSDTKQLFAGAQFLDDLPRTTTGKLRRMDLLKLVSYS